MPLHCHHPPVVIGGFDSFYDSVGRARGHPHSIGDALHRLMVEGVHTQMLATDGLREQRARLDGDVVSSRGARAFLVVIDIGFALRRDVLNQCPAEGDVQNLDAATNRQNRSSSSARLLDQCGFGRIACGVHCTYFLVTLLTIACRIHILAAGQYETRYRLQNRHGCVSARKWGNDEWYEACSFKGRHVSGGKPDTTGIAIWANASGNSNCAGWNRLARGRHEGSLFERVRWFCCSPPRRRLWHSLKT